MSISTREEFLKALDDAERLVVWLAQAGGERFRPLLGTIASHLGFARQTTAEGRVPTTDEKAALGLSTALGYLPASFGDASLDQGLGWLRVALPTIEAFFRSLDPPRAPAPQPTLGMQVTVSAPDRSRRVGFVRYLDPSHCLVAFASGEQQWLAPSQIESPPRAGERVAVVAAGRWHVVTVADFASGCYLVEFDGGAREWLEWTVVVPPQQG